MEDSSDIAGIVDETRNKLRTSHASLPERVLRVSPVLSITGLVRQAWDAASR